MLGAVCDSILGHLGTAHGLAVAKLVNYQELSARSNLPTTLLLSQRFLVAAGASRDDWISFGSLSVNHVALVLPPGAIGRRWDLQSSMDRFSVVDRAAVDSSLTMRSVGVAVELGEFESLSGLFSVVDEALNDAEGGHPASLNGTSRWCS